MDETRQRESKQQRKEMKQVKEEIDKSGGKGGSQEEK